MAAAGGGRAEEEGPASHDGEPRQAPSILAVLRRNPELVKAMAASGLQRSALMVTAILGTQNLRALVWGEHAAEYTARLSMGMSVVAMVSAGAFGRMGDRLGRRTAAALFGLTSFLPSWALLAFGFNKVGLYAGCAAFLISGVGLCSDALLVLANDVTRQDDRGVAFGLYQAATNGAAFLLFGIPSCFTVLFPILPSPSINQWLWYDFMLTAAYFLIIFSVRVPLEQPVGGSVSTPAAPNDAVELPPNVAVECPPDTANCSSQPCRPPAARAEGCAGLLRHWFHSTPLVREIRFMSSDGNLRKLYMTGALLFFSGDVVFDLGSQYFRDTLDLIPPGDLPEEARMHMLKNEQLVSVLTTLPPEIGIIPGAMLVAYLARVLGSRRLLRIMIPLAGVMTAAGAIMAAVPEYWVIPIVCLFMNYASLAANVPLKHLLAAAAPEGRTGEAMASLGMLNQAVCFIANALVMICTPILYRHLKKPLWIAYLFAGGMTALGSFTIIGLKVDEAVEASASSPPTGDKDLEAAGADRCRKKVTFGGGASLGGVVDDGSSARFSGGGGEGAPLDDARRAACATHTFVSVGSTDASSGATEDDVFWSAWRQRSRSGTMDSCPERMSGSPEASPAVRPETTQEDKPEAIP